MGGSRNPNYCQLCDDNDQKCKNSPDPSNVCKFLREKYNCPCADADYCGADRACYHRFDHNQPTYDGRGFLQLSYQYNYKPAGDALQGLLKGKLDSFYDDLDLLVHPSAVAKDPLLGWMTALYFWMTPTTGKPSAHSVMNRGVKDTWTPTADDEKYGRVVGFGTVTNIINGGVECGPYTDINKKFFPGCQEQDDCYKKTLDRVNYYHRAADILNVEIPPVEDASMSCSKEVPFGLKCDDPRCPHSGRTRSPSGVLPLV